jgi:glycosyltransferase 2 family protein
MKSVPEEGSHASLIRVDDASSGVATDTRSRRSNLRFTAIGGQVRARARTVIFLLRLLVAVGVLGLIARRIDLGAGTVRPTALLLVSIGVASALLVMSQAVAALRWRIVLGDAKLPWSYLLRLYIIGSFFSLFLPTSVGGDAVRALATARSSASTGRALASVLVDRGFGVGATLVFAVLGVALAPEALAAVGGRSVTWHTPGLAGGVLALIAIGVAVLGVRRSARLRTLWSDGLAVVCDLVRSPAALVRASALALVAQGLIVLLWFTLARGMSLPLPASTFLWAVPIVALSALLPLTLSGLGIREAVWLVLLQSSSIPPADIVTFSLLYFVCTALVGMLGGVLFVSSGMSLAPADGAPA